MLVLLFDFWLLLVLVTPASAFGTVHSSLLSQRKEHERITRAALACTSEDHRIEGSCFEPQSLNELAGQDGTFGAVGAPDAPPEGPEAHCDDADFLDHPSYPQSRASATKALQRCVQHLRRRILQGLSNADQLLNSTDQISEDEVTIQRPCVFGPISLPGRAKCNVIEAFGRALHGVQDFYSHSNWGDVALPPYSAENPPGLNFDEPAPFFDFRKAVPIAPPHNLSTGCCAGIFKDRTPGIFKCIDRITHSTMNKDNGLIDPVTGSTSDPRNKRGLVADNFDRAVQLSIEDTRRQWVNFQAELKRMYGHDRATLMICGITKDNPVRDCPANSRQPFSELSMLGRANLSCGIVVDATSVTCNSTVREVAGKLAEGKTRWNILYFLYVLEAVKMVLGKYLVDDDLIIVTGISVACFFFTRLLVNQ